MAEKTIGIRINLNGMNTVVQDIETFERLLKEAKEDLKQIPIGEQNFKNLAKEIAIAEGQLNKLNEAQKGLTSEKASEGLSKFGSGIAASFAAATAAVSLFGQESEDVSKLATQAQNLLTLALSARSIMEIRTGAAITAKIIAERASAAATTATSVATKELYATLAANPYGAIVAALGLLVSAYFLLGNEEEQVAEKTKTLNELMLENQQETAQQIVSIKSLQAVLNDETSTLEMKKGAYKELQKLIPVLNDLTLEQAQQQGILNKAITDEIKLIQLRATAKALETKLVDEKKKEIALEEEKRQAFIKSIEVEAVAEQRRITYATNSAAEGLKARQDYINRSVAAQGFKSTQEQLLAVQKEISQIEGERIIKTEKSTKATKDADAAAKKALETQKKLIDLYQKGIQLQIDLLKETADTYKKLGEVPTVDLSTPQIIENLNKIVEARRALTDKDLVDAFKEIGVQVSIVNGQFELLGDNLTKDADIFGKLYDDIRENLTRAVTDSSSTIQDITRLVESYIDELSLKLQKGEITKAAFDAFVQLTDQYQNFADVIKKKPILPVEAVKAFLDTEREIQIATGNLTKDFDESSGKVVDITTRINSLSDAQAKQAAILAGYSAQLKTSLTESFKSGDNIKELEKQLKEAGLTKEQIQEALSGIDRDKISKDATDAIDLIIKYRIEALKNITGFIIQQEEAIRKFYGDAQKAAEEGSALQAEAVKNTLLNNLNLLIDFTQKQNKVIIDEKKVQADQIISLEEQLAKKGIDITKLTEEEKLKILKEYLNKQKQEKDAAAEDDKKRTKITTEDVTKTLQQVSGLIGRLASLTAQFYAFQLTKLANENKKAAESVVGDTDEANKKRLELEAQYQKQKAEIEKRAAVKALQFQLAQAIADGAAAVLQVISIPPLAVAVGILAAAQIALIAQQLNYAQSLAGGGKIRMGAGGMVVGPSHERGGVSYPMGVNLEGGETVINRTSSLAYGDLLSSVNQLGGGQPIISNATNTLMEERLIQAIAKTRSTPIRAYVLEQDITRSQTIQRKLDQLATL